MQFFLIVFTKQEVKNSTVFYVLFSASTCCIEAHQENIFLLVNKGYY